MMNNSIGRALIIGLAIAIGAIGLFLFLYFVVLSGFDVLIQLFGSLCIPPIVIVLLVGGYYILTDDEDKNRDEAKTDDD